MKRVGFLYEKLCNRDLLVAAFKCASRGKKKKAYVIPYLENMDYYVDLLLKWLTNKTLVLSDNPKKTIYEKSAQKTREIIVPKFFPDQVVHWAYCIVMRPIFMKGMYKWNCGSIEGRGIYYGIERVYKELQKDKARYILKTDFKKYYQSINTEKLLELVKRKIKDEDMIWLTKLILDNGGDGLPIGYYTSQWFANFYLQNIDHFVKEELRVPFYIRYIDDLVFIDSNKKRLHNTKNKLDEKLANEHYSIVIKDNWQVWKKDTRPMNFLGYKIVGNQKRMRHRAWIMLNRIPRKVEKVGYCTVKRAESFISRLGWLVNCSNGIRYYLEKIKQKLSKGEACKIVSLYQKKELAI